MLAARGFAPITGSAAIALFSFIDFVFQRGQIWTPIEGQTAALKHSLGFVLLSDGGGRQTDRG
jgi:hypothetical protein